MPMQTTTHGRQTPSLETMQRGAFEGEARARGALGAAAPPARADLVSLAEDDEAQDEGGPGNRPEARDRARARDAREEEEEAHGAQQTSAGEGGGADVRPLRVGGRQEDDGLLHHDDHHEDPQEVELGAALLTPRAHHRQVDDTQTSSQQSDLRDHPHHDDNEEGADDNEEGAGQHHHEHGDDPHHPDSDHHLHHAEHHHLHDSHHHHHHHHHHLEDGGGELDQPQQVPDVNASQLEVQTQQRPLRASRRQNLDAEADHHHAQRVEEEIAADQAEDARVQADEAGELLPGDQEVEVIRNNDKANAAGQEAASGGKAAQPGAATLGAVSELQPSKLVQGSSKLKLSVKNRSILQNATFRDAMGVDNFGSEARFLNTVLSYAFDKFRDPDGRGDFAQFTKQLEDEEVQLKELMAEKWKRQYAYKARKRQLPAAEAGRKHGSYGSSRQTSGGAAVVAASTATQRGSAEIWQTMELEDANVGADARGNNSNDGGANARGHSDRSEVDREANVGHERPDARQEPPDLADAAVESDPRTSMDYDKAGDSLEPVRKRARSDLDLEAGVQTL